METLRKLNALRFRFARWLLFTWIRPTCLGGEPDTLGLQPDDLVCYVLPSRSIADLLVTDMACERAELPTPTGSIPLLEESRSVFFLGRPEGTLGRKTQRRQSERMTRLFDHQAGHHDRSIVIVPVSLFWGHQPDREKSIFKLLLSENWSVTSRVRKFFAILFHPSHILVQFGRPIRLDQLMASEAERPRQIRKLMRLLRVHFTSERQAIIGPDLSHRRTLINTILSARDVRNAIEREIRTTEARPVDIERKAHRYAHEIVSDVSYRVIRFFDVLLSWVWNKLYDGIEVNGIEQLKRLAQSHEIVYTPCHRSHIDYLLLSYVLYHNGLTPPHIAAGRNLNLPVIGALLRRAGAFYMRRSFQGDALYKEVFDEYLHQMFTKGYSVEYFIEGGRSRTGRTLPPRTGMLSMTLRSFQKDATKPIAFMPVYFGYERVIESSTYSAELSGKAKRTESVFDVFGVFSSFKHEFGKVTVNFGDAVLLRDFLDQNLPDWQESPHANGGQFSETCVNLARVLVRNINAAVAVKPSNLVALAILSTSRQSIEEGHLFDQVELLRAIAAIDANSHGSITSEPVEEIVADAIRILGLDRIERPFGTIISASPEHAVAMTYNVNNVLHVFALPSLIARYLRIVGQAEISEIAAFVQRLYPCLRSEMFLAPQPTDLPATIEHAARRLAELGLVTFEDNSVRSPRPETRAYSCLYDIANITNPTLERFYIVTALLEQNAAQTARELETAAAGIAAQLSALYGINSPDFFEKSLFSSFLLALKEQRLVDGELLDAPAFEAFADVVARTVNPDVRHNIDQAVNALLQSAASSPEVIET